MDLKKPNSTGMSRSRWHGTSWRLFIPTLCFAAVAWVGCQEKVVSVVGTEMPFSLFGVLNPMADTQWVRVFPIESTLEPAGATPLLASFVSENMTNGNRQSWADSLIQESNGQYAHVYWSPFAVTFGQTYRLEVENPEGALTQVTATIPPFSSLTLPKVQLKPPPLFPILVEGEVPKLIRIEVLYSYKYATALSVARGTALFSYDGVQERISGGWRLDINIARDSRLILEDLKSRVTINEDVGVKVVALNIKMIAANEAWNPPGGVFDPEILVQPGTLSNVENGFGFVGAGYRLEATWIPIDTLITSTSG